MLSKGFPATKVDEICKAAGVTKGSFYHHFESKDDLAIALIDHYFDRLLSAFEDQSWLDHEDPADRVLAFLDDVIAMMKGPMLKHGCLLGSFALDLSQTHPQIREIIDNRLSTLTCVLEPHFREALKSHRNKAGLNAKMLSRQFMAVLQGGIVLSKASDDHERIAESMQCFKQLVFMLLKGSGD